MIDVRVIWTCDDCADFGMADTQEKATARAVAHAEIRHSVRQDNLITRTKQTMRVGD